MVAKQLNTETFSENFFFYFFDQVALYSLKGFSIRKRIKKLENDIKPDVVFSVFGPSWWTPKAKHLQGYAYPHYVYPDSPLFQMISRKEKFKIALMKQIHLFFLNKNGNYFVSETENVTHRLKNLLKKTSKFYTVGNTCSLNYDLFLDHKLSTKQLLPDKQEQEFRFLSLCTYHQHKNLEILNEVVPILNNKLPEANIKFVLTIDTENFNNKFTEEAKKNIINIGRIDTNQCPQLYSECDALFLPTLLECFSANYPEAMKMGKPIATSDLEFAKTVCKNAAIYFNPVNADDIAKKISILYRDHKVRENLVKYGKEQLKSFPSSAERACQYLKICKEISK